MPVNESHPVMKAPTANIKLWRYMDVPSFFALLIDSKLCFSRADLMEDRFEGTFPMVSSQLLDEQAKLLIERGELKPGYRQLSRILTEDKTHVFLSCWSHEDTEMIHMWKIYSKEWGVAIETTYEALKLAICDSEQVYPTLVQYANFEQDLIDWRQNALTVFTIKRREYKSESEFRLIVSHPRQNEDQLLGYKTHEEKKGPSRNLYSQTRVVKIEVDLFKLLKVVHISPFAPSWYKDLIKGALVRFGLDMINVRRSEL
jgi:hypothetical protein